MQAAKQRDPSLSDSNQPPRGRHATEKSGQIISGRSSPLGNCSKATLIRRVVKGLRSLSGLYLLLAIILVQALVQCRSPVAAARGNTSHWIAGSGRPTTSACPSLMVISTTH